MPVRADMTKARLQYGAVAQAFHWLTGVLIVIAFTYGPGGSEQRVYSAARDFDRQLHETLGFCLLALILLRLLWRLIDTRPEPEPVARWMHVTSRLMQWALYLMMLALPITAICGAWLEGHPLTLLGGLRFAPQVAPSHDLGATIAEIHGWLGDAILWLAGFHALAAIYHHIFLKDGVLMSMLPRWFPLARLFPAAQSSRPPSEDASA